MRSEEPRAVRGVNWSVAFPWPPLCGGFHTRCAFLRDGLEVLCKNKGIRSESFPRRTLILTRRALVGRYDDLVQIKR